MGATRPTTLPLKEHQIKLAPLTRTITPSTLRRLLAERASSHLSAESLDAFMAETEEATFNRQPYELINKLLKPWLTVMLFILSPTWQDALAQAMSRSNVHLSEGRSAASWSSATMVLKLGRRATYTSGLREPSQTGNVSETFLEVGPSYQNLNFCFLL